VNKVKKPTPNQRYQAMITRYLSYPDKLAIFEEQLRSLPVDTTDLSGTHYANIDPYEHLFILSRLLRIRTRNSPIHKAIKLNIQIMKAQMNVEVNRSLLKDLDAAGVPLSEEHAASLQEFSPFDVGRELRVLQDMLIFSEAL
jgi:hypothetical protein